jgi:hypothetical protein
MKIFEKAKNFYKEANLKCSNCGNQIKENELFSVTLTLPSDSKMPVGVLDKVLAKQAKEILCSNCKGF